MNTSTQYRQYREPNGIVQPSEDLSWSERKPSGLRRAPSLHRLTTWLAGLVCLLLVTSAARADREPANCTGSGLGISLFTSIPDVHIGDTLRYSINVFNGVAGSGRIACDATAIQAFIVTPDGVTHTIPLVRTTLHQGESDFYLDVVSYVVRAQDIQPDGTLLATARDTGVIHQNDTDSVGGGFQGVNTEVNLPCLLISALCVGGVGENGAITFTGTVTNCGNNTLVGVTVTNFHEGGNFAVLFPINLARGESANFSGSYIPVNPCAPSTAILTVRASDEFTATPRLVTNFTTVICQNTLTPGIKVTKVCPAGPVSPGQMLTFSGSVSNTGNITLTNIVVVNNQPAANTTVFTLASLAPGAVANFTGSYLAPTNCSVADTLTATANSRCGGAVSSSASATCPILTNPGITVTVPCPAGQLTPGSTVRYVGTVRNTGDVTLNNIQVVSDRPSPNTHVDFSGSLVPGDSVNFQVEYTVPANACAFTTTFRATGAGACTGNATNTFVTTCTIATAPAIVVTQSCPPSPVSPGGLLTYSGTVRNAGSITLTNVSVVNNQSGAGPIFTIATLAPGVTANFTGSYTAPNDCSTMSTSTATGQSICGVTVTHAASTTCPIGTAPALVVTQACPASPVSPGGLLTYSGTVRNTGNITLTNVVVVNNQSGATPILTVATLAPGAVASFTGSYVVTTECSSTSTSTATGRSTCGVAVTGTVSSTCTILSTPQIAVTAVCPAVPIVPGGSFTYSGTVRNTGNVTLVNVVVVSDRPVANTTVFTAATLAPGATANFTETYTVPANACAVTTTFSGTGKDICTPVTVTNTVTTTCTGTTAPGIAVTLACPVGATSSGGLISYTGTVRNSGNVTLNNVFVVNNQPAPNTAVIGPITLAPGASVNFTTSFTAPADACSVSSTVNATGTDNCTSAQVSNAASATCALGTTPSIAITQACPVAPAVPGGLLTYTGTVRNTGTVTLTNVVVVNNQSGAAPILTVATLAPGAVASFTGSYVAPADCASTSTSTATGRSTCGVAVTGTVSSTCPILTAPQIAVTAACPATPIVPGGSFTYSGTVRNTGNIMLTNVVVVSDRPVANTVVFTAAALAPGAVASFTSTATVPANACAVTTTFSGSGRDCTPTTVTGSVSTTCMVTTAPAVAVTLACPVVAATPGSLINYTGTVSNPGNVTLTNVFVVNNQPAPNSAVIGPITLAPGASVNFTTSFTTPVAACAVSSTVTATGNDNCSAALVSNTASATCTLLTTPGIAITQACPVAPAVPGGLLTYTGTVRNTGNITLTNVVVVNNQSGAAPVLTVATLAPGATASFTGSYVAPTACDSTSISTATGGSICGVSVTNTASATCPILTTPAIVVTQICPAVTVLQGGILTYSGTVRNAGNITLTNIIVVNNQPATNTVIFTLASLAPGATANFTGSYQVPDDCCVVSSTVRASGQGCVGETVTDTATRTCPVVGSPRIVVTKVCPPGLLRPGELLTYSGTVSNAGSITLINVTVVNNQPGGGSTILVPGILAPGESFNYTASHLIPSDFCGTDTVTARGLDICTFLPVVNSVTTTCPVTLAPRIAVTKNCPLVPTPLGGLFTYTGSVSNAGNVTLNNVFVVDNMPSPNTAVIGPITLAPGASVNFSGSYLAPTDCCEIVDTVTARGQDICSGSNVTATATAFCPLLSAPAIVVVQNCPVVPIPMGSDYRFSGYVTNTGNVVLTNVFVFGPQGTNSPVLGPIELAPGESEVYSGGYTVPFNTCTVAVTASGKDGLCGTNVVNNTASCPVATTPQIAVTVACPVSPIVPGGSATYSGTVQNTGNITLVNVAVVSDRPAPNTTVFTVPTLAPGASANFSGTHTVPANACFVTTTYSATGKDMCTPTTVTNNASTTCTVTTTPLIAVTQTCPPGPVVAGSPVAYTGSVSNAGNITLTNVLVFSSQPSGSGPVLGPITLAPGASAPFAGSYTASGGSNPTTNTTVATNSSSTITTNMSSEITTNTTTTVSTNTTTPTFGTIDPVTGILADRFNVVSNLHGLMFADQDQQWGATLFYTTRHPGSGADQFVSISTAGAGSVTDRFALTSTNYDALTLAAPDVGYGSVNFYYLRHSSPGVNTFGVIKAAGASSSSDLPVSPIAGTNYNSLAFAEADVAGYGANLFYSLRETNGVTVFGTIAPSPGLAPLDRYTVGTNANFDSMVFVPGAVSSWGTAQFAYLRHDNIGSIIGSINPVTQVVTDRFSLGTNFLDALTFTATDVGYGPNLFYYLRPARSSMTTNTFTTFTTNSVTTFTTNTTTTFTTNSVVTFTPTNTVTATGTDICQARTVSAAANCSGAVAAARVPVIFAPALVNGSVSLAFPTANGQSHTVQYKDALSDPAWTDLQTVVGTGGNLTVMDPAAGQRPKRFYRIIDTP